MKIAVKLTIINEDKFFGPGTLELLKHVEKTGCLFTAAERMGLSYSKARKMIKNFQQETGESTIITQAGGAGGGSAMLTPYAKSFMEKYERLEKEVEEFTRLKFGEIYEA